jgi:hypothetical protein
VIDVNVGSLIITNVPLGRGDMFIIGEIIHVRSRRCMGNICIFI